MQRHKELLQPKFNIVLDTMQQQLAPVGVATWSNPHGGYFISVNVMEGCAKHVVELCRDAGVTLTDAGATYPYGKDPKDANIRIAPSYPSVQELQEAMNVFCVAVKLAALERLSASNI